MIGQTYIGLGTKTWQMSKKLVQCAKSLDKNPTELQVTTYQG